MLTLRSPATRDFRSIIRRADFAQIALVLLFASVAIEEDCLIEAIFTNRCQYQMQGMSHKNLNKNVTHIPRFYWNIYKKRQMGRVKSDFVPPSRA